MRSKLLLAVLAPVLLGTGGVGRGLRVARRARREPRLPLRLLRPRSADAPAAKLPPLPEAPHARPSSSRVARRRRRGRRRARRAAAPARPAGVRRRATTCALARPTTAGDGIHDATALPNGIALPPLEAPEAVRQIIEAGNVIARSPYLWGGGHGKWVDTGYDCSGSVSFALAAAGLLQAPLASGPLMSWGEPGPGKLGDDLLQPRPRLHGRRRHPLRHLGAARDRLALAERHALHRGLRRPPSGRALTLAAGPRRFPAPHGAEARPAAPPGADAGSEARVPPDHDRSVSRFHATSDDLPAGPPPEVQAEIDAAWGRAQALVAAGLELRFEVDRERGRAWAELLRADGSVAARLTALEAIAIACGGELPEGFDAP